MMNNNPFAIRKSPVEIIAAQAVALDDYVMREDNGFAGIPRGGKLAGSRPDSDGGGNAGPVKFCTTIF
jgi:hypothetical protein